MLSPDGDDRETKGWRDDDRGHGRHWHGPKLIVDQDKGTVGEDDPCPTPRSTGRELSYRLYWVPINPREVAHCSK